VAKMVNCECNCVNIREDLWHLAERYAEMIDDIDLSINYKDDVDLTEILNYLISLNDYKDEKINSLHIKLLKRDT